MKRVRSSALLTLGLLFPVHMSAQVWPVHSMDRPRPPVVDPGPERPPVPPPPDAIVLFDGRNLDHWQHGESQPARWAVRDGYVEVVQSTGSLVTRQAFGDVQLHIEWAAPVGSTGSGQGRGNSGVFLMTRYEVQVLDSYRNDTYADGQAAALYGQTPPLVNACRPPGKWQTYDIVFRRPRFGPDGTVVRPARITVLHNGLLVHDAVEFTGRTTHARAAQYEPHAGRMPISLQDHGDPVRYRNIWVRALPEDP
ncbi:MAG: 3-keto-disaccharide hydrolase [Gemmatimonadales bacterium]